MKRRSRREHTRSRLLNCVDQAAASGDRCATYLATEQYCMSFFAHLYAAEKLKSMPRLSNMRNAHLSATELAERSLNWNASDEKVTVSIGGTCSDGSARLTFNFGAINRVRQMVVREVLYRKGRVDDAQTMMNGGQTRAVQRVIDNYRDGYRFITQVDIKRCYPSFDSVRTGLLFALPEKVTANSLGMQNLTLWPSPYVRKEWLHLSGSEDACRITELFLDRFGDEFATARPGLIEGSMASPYIVEMLLATACKSLRTSGHGRVVCYADNFLLMAETPDGLLAMERRLRNELQAHPVGAHKVHVDRYTSGQFIDFLGYRLEPADKRLIPHPGEKVLKNANAIRKQAYKILNSKMPLDRKRKELHQAIKTHWDTVNSLRLWDGRKAFHEDKMQEFAQALDKASACTDTPVGQGRPRYRPRP